MNERYITRTYENAFIILDKRNWNSLFVEGELSSFCNSLLYDIDKEIDKSYFEGYSDDDCLLINENIAEIRESFKNFISQDNIHNNKVQNTNLINGTQKLIEYAKQNWQITSVDFELLTKCNLNCNMCYLPEHSEKGLDIQLIKKIAHELKEIGVLYVSFTGGEPFLRKDFIEILEYYDNLGFAIEIKTNGLLINESIISILKKLSIIDIQISIYEIENKFSNFINSYYDFDKLFEIICNLKKNEIPVTLSVIASRNNIDELDRFDKKLKLTGFNIFYNPLITPNFEKIEQIQNLRLTTEELWNKFYPFLKTNDYIENVKQYRNCDKENTVCFAGRNQIAIRANGEILPCLDLNYKIGNVLNQSLKQIVNNRSILEKFSIKEMPKCLNCEIINFCDSCIGIALSENKDYTKPLLHKCDISKFMYKAAVMNDKVL